MRPRLRSAFRLLFILTFLLWGGRALAQSCTRSTTITGTVYAPNGTDPLPNILVYIATTPVQPFAGAGPGPDCAHQYGIVSGGPLVSTTTDYKGNFSLTSASMPNVVNIVVQAGKWRRQYPNTPVTACGGTTTVGKLQMPANGAQGDLPKIAVVTGSADAVECVFQSIGIANSEYSDPSGTGHINLYSGTSSTGAKYSASSPTELSLMSNPTLLNSYDLLLLGCQGTYENDTTEANVTYQQNLASFANSGGRIFATHYEYIWLDKPATFATAAHWRPDESSITPNGGTGTITVDTSYTEGVVLANWLQYIGASPVGGYGQITNVPNLRQDQTGVIAPTQSWGTLNPPYASGTIGTPVMQFTFDTPQTGTTTPSVALNFTNNPASFHIGDTGDTVTINVTDTSTTTPADMTLSMALTIPSSLTPVSLAGVNANSGWICSITTLVCNRTIPLAAGASDPVALVVNVAATATAGSAPVSAAISGGGLSGTNQCGRVLFNEYHVENFSGAGKTGLAECPAATEQTAAEKFLEFSLYNLSNFVAPVSSDPLVIQGTPVLTWPTPAPIFYGTPLSSTQLDATSSVPGTFVYSPAAGTVSAVGNDTLTVTFTPTDSVDYTTATASVTLEVDKAPSNTTIVDLITPIYYGQEIGNVNGINALVSAGVPAVGGTLTVYVDGTMVCTLPAYIASSCADPPFQGFAAGAHSVYAVFSGDTDYLASTSPTYIVTILPDNTAATLTTSVNPSIFGQAVNFTTQVSAPYAIPTGLVTFYDGATVIGMAALNAQGVAVFTTFNLEIGTHNITAHYRASQNFNATVSPILQQVVNSVDSAPSATVTLLNSNNNPSSVGQNVTFSITVGTTGAFVMLPSGTVTLYDGATLLGTITLDATGAGSFSTSSLTLGTHTLLAKYAGNSKTAASVSQPFVQQVNTPLAAAPNDFTLTINPTNFSVGVGSSISLSVVVSEIVSFNQTVQLSCSGLPVEVTCAFAQSILPAGGGTTRLTVSPSAPHDCTNASPYFVAGNAGSPMTWFATSALVLFFARKRRRLFTGLTLALALCALPMLSGCGSGRCTDFGTKPNTYTFTVTGTSTGSPAVTHSQTMQMIVHI